MKINHYFIACFTALLIIGNANIFAQCSINQFQDSSNAGRSARNLPGYYEGQTFTPNSSGVLCEVAMLMFVTGSGTGTLNIYNGSGINGTVIHTQQVTVNIPGASSVWQNWTLNNPPSVSSGQIYTFQFVPTQGGGIPDPYGVNVIATDAYSGGNDLGEPTWDLCFRTYVDVTTGTNDPMVENSAAVYVYPNPAGNLVSVRCKNGFQLFSLEGRLIKESNMPCNSINLEDIQEGLYLLKTDAKTAKLMVKR